MLWGVQCLGKLKPWKTPRWAVYHYLESPGTKSYTTAEARQLFAAFSEVKIRTRLTHGDLLMLKPSQQYQSSLHRLAWRLYPRWAIRLTGNRWGTSMFIEVVK